jgi:hypothetical protein
MCKLHSCCEGGVVDFPSVVVKVTSYSVHGRNNGGDAGRVLREEECCVLVLLQKGVRMWVDNVHEYVQVRWQQDLQQSPTPLFPAQTSEA